MVSGSFSGAISPGRISVDDRIGSPNSASSACTTGWSGTRKPIVWRLGCSNRRGTSRVPGSRNVNAPGNALPDDAELPVVEPREAARVRQVAAHERQVMRVVDAANVADALGRADVAQLAAERVARVRRIGNDATLAQDDRRLPDQARLRVRRVNAEKLGHRE